MIQRSSHVFALGCAARMFDKLRCNETNVMKKEEKKTEKKRRLGHFTAFVDILLQKRKNGVPPAVSSIVAYAVPWAHLAPFSGRLLLLLPVAVWRSHQTRVAHRTRCSVPVRWGVASQPQPRRRRVCVITFAHANQQNHCSFFFSSAGSTAICSLSP
jgi:hypothetical protein